MSSGICLSSWVSCSASASFSGRFFPPGDRGGHQELPPHLVQQPCWKEHAASCLPFSWHDSCLKTSLGQKRGSHIHLRSRITSSTQNGGEWFLDGSSDSATWKRGTGCLGGRNPIRDLLQNFKRFSMYKIWAVAWPFRAGFGSWKEALGSVFKGTRSGMRMQDASLLILVLPFRMQKQ